MVIAVAYKDNEIYEHFGHAEMFAIYKTNEDQTELVSKELESAILEARREKAKTQKQLKNVRKELNADIESLGFTLKVINIVLVPVLVILFGILRAVVRRRR